MTLSEYIEKKEKAIATLETVKYEATEMAIKALEQQPSDDCVSRKAVDLLCFKYLKPNDDNVAFYEHFLDLPPVTPTFPKGTTNGDVISAMFPSLKIANDGLINDNLTGIMAFYGGYGSPLPRGDNYFNRKWWNAPYEDKRGNENER